MRASLPFMSHMPDWLVKGAASVGGLGNIGPAPGTLGSIAGTIFYAVALMNTSPGFAFATTLFMLVVGVFICDEAEIRLKRTDPGCVVLDEFAAMPIVYAGIVWPNGLVGTIAVLVAGLFLFRVFDILKPLGIARIQDLPGGLGVMADDLAAALASCIILHAGLAIIAIL